MRALEHTGAGERGWAVLVTIGLIAALFLGAVGFVVWKASSDDSPASALSPAPVEDAQGRTRAPMDTDSVPAPPIPGSGVQEGLPEG